MRRGRGGLGWRLGAGVSIGRRVCEGKGRLTDCARVGLHGGVQVGQDADDIGFSALDGRGGSERQRAQGKQGEVGDAHFGDGGLRIMAGCEVSECGSGGESNNAWKTVVLYTSPI
jgi:hypothetical protein